MNYANGGGSPDGVMTFSIPKLTAGLAAHPIDPSYQLWIFLALFAGFAIKVPLFPLHTWLPLAHTQAPAAGSREGGRSDPGRERGRYAEDVRGSEGAPRGR